MQLFRGKERLVLIEKLFALKISWNEEEMRQFRCVEQHDYCQQHSCLLSKHRYNLQIIH